MEMSLACWKAAEDAFDRSGQARSAMTGKRRRDVGDNAARIESANSNRPINELLDWIDFEAT
jgi:hypothetical protein